MKGRFATILSLVAGLAGCAVPRTVEYYDEDCGVVARKMVLETTEALPLQHCSNQGCAAQILAQLAGFAVSAVVSGSIVIVGNVAYWAERQRNCRTPPARPDPGT